MLEEQLEKRMFLNKAGAFSIRRGSRSAIDSIKYSAEILKDRDNLLCLFPQGEIQTHYKFPVRFEKGWFKIIERLENPVRIVFLANIIDYFSNRKPSLFQYVKDFDGTSGNSSPGVIEEAFNEHLEFSIQMQKE